MMARRLWRPIRPKPLMATRWLKDVPSLDVGPQYTDCEGPRPPASCVRRSDYPTEVAIRSISRRRYAIAALLTGGLARAANCAKVRSGCAMRSRAASRNALLKRDTRAGCTTNSAASRWRTLVVAAREALAASLLTRRRVTFFV